MGEATTRPIHCNIVSHSGSARGCVEGEVRTRRSAGGYADACGNYIPCWTTGTDRRRRRAQVDRSAEAVEAVHPNIGECGRSCL